MSDVMTPTGSHVAMATAAELLAGTGPLAPQARAVQFATGFEPLDDVLGGGIRAQDLVLLGGRPGIGKTVASLQWARWMAMQGHTSIYVCYEHSPHSLLGRLLALELGSLARPDEVVELTRLRTIAQEVALGASPAEALTSDPLGEEAYHRLQQYGPRLRLVQGSGLRTGVTELAGIVSKHREGSTALFVDYLQKIPVSIELEHDEERTTYLAEQLKELAMVAEVPVVALAAADKAGIDSRRLRLNHLRGSTALGHECDIAILLNEKAVSVSKSHLAFDPVRAEQFKRWVVFSVEKNREGAPDMNLEFRKDLANYRFDPAGGFVAEALVDRVLFED
jgi:replicative DNA helicase